MMIASFISAAGENHGSGRKSKASRAVEAGDGLVPLAEVGAAGKKVRPHHRRRLGRGLRRLQQLEVELLGELAAELGALGPADLGVAPAARRAVELAHRAARAA